MFRTLILNSIEGCGNGESNHSFSVINDYHISLFSISVVENTFDFVYRDVFLDWQFQCSHGQSVPKPMRSALTFQNNVY